MDDPSMWIEWHGRVYVFSDEEEHQQRSGGFPTAGGDMRLPSHGALPEKKASQQGKPSWH
jgi:hypothetical protein